MTLTKEEIDLLVSINDKTTINVSKMIKTFGIDKVNKFLALQDRLYLEFDKLKTTV